MLSRVAESIYWMSRYIERADNVARFIDVNSHMTLDQAVTAEAQWMPLVNTTGDVQEFEERYGAPTRENVIHFLTFDSNYDNSIVSCVRRARENARSIREVISSEMWEQVNSFYLMVTESARRGDAMFAPHDFFAEIRRASQLFAGVTDSTMSHGEGWHFNRLGTMLERADKTSRILDVKYFILLPSLSLVGSPFDDLQWSAVLRSTSAYEMYRKQYGRLAPKSIVEFLILDRSFPRSIHFCLRRAEESMYAISGSEPGTFRNPAEQGVGQLRAELAYMRVDDIVASGMHEFIDGLQVKLNQIGASIHESFFAMRPYEQRIVRQFQWQS